MKKFTILFIYVLFSNVIISQTDFNPKVIQSQLTDSKWLGIDLKYIGVIDNIIYYSYFLRGKNWIIEVDKNSLKILSKNKLISKYEGKKLIFFNLFVFGGKLVNISSYKDSNSEKKYFFSRTYIGEGKFAVPKIIAEINYEGIPNMGGSIESNTLVATGYQSFKISRSEDNKSLLVMSKVNVLDEGDDAYKWKVTIFDDNFETISSSDFQSNTKDYFLIDQIKLTNEGDIYILGMTYFDVKKDLGKYYVDLTMSDYFSYSSDSLFIVKIRKTDILYKKIRLPENKEYISMSLGVLENGVALYGVQGVRSKKTVENAFVIKLDNELDEDFRTTESIYRENVSDKPTLNELFTNSNADNMYVLSKLYENKNGYLSFIVEEIDFSFSSGDFSFSSGDSGFPSSSYLVESLLIIRFDNKGNFEWKDLLYEYEKKSSKRIYTSYLPIIKDDEIYILYQDSEFNLNKSKYTNSSLREVNKAKSKPLSIVLSYSESGEKSFESLNFIENETFPIPNFKFAYNNDIEKELIINLMDSSGNDHFVRLKYH